QEFGESRGHLQQPESWSYVCLQGKSNGKRASAAQTPYEFDPSVMLLYDMGRQRETEPRSCDSFSFRGLNAMEFFKDPLLLLTGDPDAMIDNIHECFLWSASHAHLDAPRRPRVFHRVAEKIENCLFESFGIGE